MIGFFVQLKSNGLRVRAMPTDGLNNVGSMDYVRIVYNLDDMGIVGLMAGSGNNFAYCQAKTEVEMTLARFYQNLYQARSSRFTPWAYLLLGKLRLMTRWASSRRSVSFSLS